MTEPRYVATLDPGLAHVGWSVVTRFGAKLDLVDSGHIETDPDEELNARLKRIWLKWATVLRYYRPSLVGVEDQLKVAAAARGRAQAIAKAVREGKRAPKELGFNANNDPVMIVVGVAKTVAFSYCAEVMDYAPTQAKKAVTNDSYAEKGAVRAAVRHYFPGYEQLMGRIIDLNEADAIAGAIYCERVTYLDAKRRVRRTG